jgi:outer membrane protein
VSSAPFELNIKEAVEIVYDRRADLRALQKQKEAAVESVRLSQKGYFPTLSGFASYTYVGPEFPLDSGWYAGANLILPLFTGFLTKNQVVEAKANLEVLNANERGLKQSILLDLEQAFSALKEASESRRKTEISVKQAKENQELATERYRSGIGTPAELSDALVAYANARLNDIAALYDYKIAQAKIERAIGRTD